MRCPNCRHDQKYKDGVRCGKCGYSFVLRKKNDGISDHALQRLIQRLSDNGQYAFTVTQLALDICRYWRGTMAGPLGTGIFAMIIALGLLIVTQRWGISLIAFSILLLLLLGVSRWRKAALPLGKARDLIRRYHQAHPIAGLADGAAFRQPAAAVDLEDLHYAPERILVVEHDDLVDMLIRNRFHLTSKTAVVSCSGYPAQVVAACREFLRRHPHTPVQLLHDASLKGFNLGNKLAADSHWPLAPHPLIDLGLSRATLNGNTRLPWLPANDQAKGVLSARHAKMLSAGHRVPVDCLGPKPFLGLLGAAVISGALVLAATDALGEISVETDYG